ncbi:MAG: hypothetical protein ACOC53_01240 [Candidatus Saliniplasma sp.]
MSDEKEKLRKYVKLVSQKKFNEWAKGERSLADLIREHHFLATIYKSKIDEAIHEHTPHQFLEIFEEERPDIDFGDEKQVEQRIRNEMDEIEKAI